MLNWLKRRAKVSFQSRYINILRRSNHPEMFLTDQNMFNQQQCHTGNIKLYIFNEEGEEYCLDVPFEMTLDRVKLMAIGHFYTPMEAFGGNHSLLCEDSDKAKTSETNDQYRLVLVRGLRTLSEESSVVAEHLLEKDEILLVECRKNVQQSPHSFTQTPTPEQIAKETCNLIHKNMNREADPANPALDFKIALRQILLTMIEASIHLIAPEDNAADLFVLVFEHLEKRHKPRVDKAYLNQLTEMGFTEAKAIKALQLKRTLNEATAWLLDESDKQSSCPESESDILLLSPEKRKEFFMSDKDPAEKVMLEFKKYVEKWFVPDTRALQNIMSLGYGEDVAKEALRTACNNETAAKELLEGRPRSAENAHRGFDRDSPIMSAILDSPIVQVALSKPKTLFALMVLCETPNNVNVWLSDPETHPVVSQVLRIYHAEKHRLWVDDASKLETSSNANITTENNDATDENTLSNSQTSSNATSNPVANLDLPFLFTDILAVTPINVNDNATDIQHQIPTNQSQSSVSVEPMSHSGSPSHSGPANSMNFSPEFTSISQQLGDIEGPNSSQSGSSNGVLSNQVNGEELLKQTIYSAKNVDMEDENSGENHMET